MAFGLEHLGGNQGCERAQGFCGSPHPACVSLFFPLSVGKLGENWNELFGLDEIFINNTR